LATVTAIRRVEAKWVLARVERIIVQAQYDDEVMDMPLGRLYGLDDEWDGGWGRTPAQLKALIEAGCAEQLRVGRGLGLGADGALER
jgi:hypothetical protein